MISMAQLYQRLCIGTSSAGAGLVAPAPARRARNPRLTLTPNHLTTPTAHPYDTERGWIRCFKAQGLAMIGSEKDTGVASPNPTQTQRAEGILASRHLTVSLLARHFAVSNGTPHAPTASHSRLFSISTVIAGISL